MYKIERMNYGFRLTFSDFIKDDEMKSWVDESRRVVTQSVLGFGVFVDMRQLKPLAPSAQAIMQTGQKLYKQQGMTRSVVIVNNSLLKMQFQRIAQETGIYEWERYLDASTQADWEQAGVAWISKGQDPDK